MMYRNTGKSQNQNEPQQTQPQGIRIDGFGQILDMLRVADHSFRESLLARISIRDPSLSNQLRERLRVEGIR